jgi:hypothetical protein
LHHRSSTSFGPDSRTGAFLGRPCGRALAAPPRGHTRGRPLLAPPPPRGARPGPAPPAPAGRGRARPQLAPRAPAPALASDPSIAAYFTAAVGRHMRRLRSGAATRSKTKGLRVRTPAATAAQPGRGAGARGAARRSPVSPVPGQRGRTSVLAPLNRLRSKTPLPRCLSIPRTPHGMMQ